MLIKNNKITNEISKITGISPIYTRKVINTLYSYLLNELIINGEVSDYIIKMKYDKNNKKLSLLEVQENFKKVLEQKVDDEVLVSLIEESDVL